VRRTEELRKKRHQSRKEKELSGWRHFLCSLWRWNQKTAKSPREPTVYRPYFIIIISIVDIIVLAAEIGINKGIESLSVNPLVGPSEQTLLDLGAKYGPYMKSGGGAWRFFAPIVMHVGIIHLLVNLCSQLQMIPLEKQYGCQRIIPIYLLSGIASVLSSVIFVPNLVMARTRVGIIAMTDTTTTTLPRWELLDPYSGSLEYWALISYRTGSVSNTHFSMQRFG